MSPIRVILTGPQILAALEFRKTPDWFRSRYAKSEAIK